MKKKKILIVEDQVIIAIDIRNTLEGLGYDVSDTASSGEECLESVMRDVPDLILMDIMLSGELDGISTAEKIQSEMDIPIIYLTAHSDEKSLERANLTGPYGYIVKPIEEKELYTAIEIALHRCDIDRELRKREVKYRTLFEQSFDPIFMADDRGIITDANQAMIELFDYTEDELLGLKLRQLFDDVEHYREFVYQTEEKGSVKNFDTRMRCSSGKIIEVFITLKKLDSSLHVSEGYQGIIRDVTAYKMYFEELRRSRQELRDLSSHIESLREKERTDIAREIHDVLGQSLTALRIDLSWLKKRISPSEKEMVEKTGIMDSLINEIIFTVRKLSASLRPGILDDLGLGAAIEWQSAEFRKRTGYACRVECEEIMELPEDISVAFFRIYQESINNILKHACASEVGIVLRKNDNIVEMTIADNGKGISSNDLSNRGSYGIIGMRERVNSLNGNLSIDGIDGKGTTVRVRIPCNAGESHD